MFNMLLNTVNSGVVDTPTNNNSNSANVTTYGIEFNLDVTSFVFGAIAVLVIGIIIFGIYEFILTKRSKKEDEPTDKTTDKIKGEEEHE